jgi:hypothetical protein
MSCNVCNSLECNNDGDKALSLWMAPASLLESAELGCPFCRLLCDSIACYLHEERLRQRVRVVYVSVRRYGNGNRTKIELFWEDGSYEMKFELFVLKGILPPLYELIHPIN